MAAGRDSAYVSLLDWNFDDFAAHVVAALRTDDMRRQGIAALRAKRQLFGMLGVMRTAPAGSRIRLPSLGYSHSGKPCNRWGFLEPAGLGCVGPGS